MNEHDISGKVALVSGANAGIGKQIALGMAQRGARLVMLCRNPDKAEAARDEIVGETGNHDIAILLADMADQEQIRSACSQFRERFEQLDILMNNAGMLDDERHLTKDGIEKTFAVNHLGYHLTTKLLLPELGRSDYARIVNTASEAHRFNDFRLDDLSLEQGYSTMKAYGNSKLANIMFTYELDKRLGDSHITCNAFHPGGVATGFGDDSGFFFSLIWRLSKPFMRSAEQGAETGIYLAVSKEVDGVSGRYFKDKSETQPAAKATDDELTQALWEISEQMVAE